MTPTMSAKAHAKHLDQMYASARKSAIFVVGGEAAWGIIGPVFRKAFIAEQILNVVNVQDASIAGDTIREIAFALTERMYNDTTLHA